MREVFQVFLRIGLLGFGGPIATVAQMESEVVKRRRWISPEQFSRSYALIKLFPGATALQMAVHLGRLRAGFFGGVAAGLLFLLPAVLFVLILSIYYESFQTFPQAPKLFLGFQIGALAVIAESVTRMAKPYTKSRKSMLIALAAAFLVWLKPSAEPLVILGFGLMGVAMVNRWLVVVPMGISGLWASDALSLMGVFLKASLLIFGSGLAIVPLLEADVVLKHQWLTHAEFLDGIAMGQITPGPVMTTATFIGYKVMGFGGAAIATTAMFLPGFLFMLFLMPYLEKNISQKAWLAEFSASAVPAVIGALFASFIRLSLLSVNTGAAMTVFALSTITLLYFQTPVWLVIPLAGFLHFLLPVF